jgi:hypothetical protein
MTPKSHREASPIPGARYRIADHVNGGGKTLTVQRIVHPFPASIRSPYVECWIAGELVWLPLDERWKNMEQIGALPPPTKETKR